MPFAYYDRLSSRRKQIYRRSDRLPAIELPDPEPLPAIARQIVAALANDDRDQVERASQSLVDAMTRQLGVPSIRVLVRDTRPSADWGELHGLYTREAGRTPRIQLWMRTAHHKRLVAFRTFLRTLLHEIGHHVDYERLELADSFHTEGFFRRESSLFHQLVPEARTAAARVDAPE